MKKVLAIIPALFMFTPAIAKVEVTVNNPKEITIFAEKASANEIVTAVLDKIGVKAGQVEIVDLTDKAKIVSTKNSLGQPDKITGNALHDILGKTLNSYYNYSLVMNADMTPARIVIQDK